MKTFKEFIIESQEVLNKISAAWERKHPGMKFSIHQDTSGDIRLNKIEVPKDKRGSGVGGRAIRGLSNYADRNKKRITLTQEPESGYKGKLDKFYKERGFVSNSGRNKDYSVSDSMIRNPR